MAYAAASGLEGEVEVQLLVRTASLADDYQRLEPEGSHFRIPVAPLALEGNVLWFALPSDVVPWAYSQLVSLADVYDTSPSHDGQVGAVSILACHYNVAMNM